MIFPQEFFKEETRDGFLITEMMKRAWSAALEVLDVIGGVCDKNGLRYYAYGGTLLGAVRHKGFIPWDDDIDICMLRADYDRFFEIADNELPEGFRVSGVFASEARLIAANKEPQGRVIADETYFTLPKYMDYFHGFPYMRIGVDIFPMDYLPDDPLKQYELVKKVNLMQTTARYIDVYRKDGSLASRLDSFRELLADIPYNSDDDTETAHAIWLASDRLAASTAQTDKVFDVLYLTANMDPEGFEGYPFADPEGFGAGTKLPFEHMTMRVPENYPEVLTAEFGRNYMTPIRFAAGHGYPFYESQEEAFAKLLRESGVNTSVDEFCRNWHKMNGGT